MAEAVEWPGNSDSGSRDDRSSGRVAVRQMMRSTSSQCTCRWRPSAGRSAAALRSLSDICRSADILCGSRNADTPQGETACPLLMSHGGNCPPSSVQRRTSTLELRQLAEQRLLADIGEPCQMTKTSAARDSTVQAHSRLFQYPRLIRRCAILILHKIGNTWEVSMRSVDRIVEVAEGGVRHRTHVPKRSHPLSPHRGMQSAAACQAFDRNLSGFAASVSGRMTDSLNQW